MIVTIIVFFTITWIVGGCVILFAFDRIERMQLEIDALYIDLECLTKTVNEPRAARRMLMPDSWPHSR